VLPLSARNPFMLAILASGVNFAGNQIYQRPFDNGAIAGWSVNGGLDRKNEFLLDGAPNNAQVGGNNIALVPPVDSVQEFKIQTNSFDAQYGKPSGGIMNVSLKSGTNGFHGTVYEFLRRSALDANSFQNNAAGVAKASHFLDQYGVSMGALSSFRNSTTAENKSFQVRAEAFNVFNSYWKSGGSGVNNQFAHSPDNSNFGQIIKGTVAQGANNFSRQIQLGFKFIY
jgi:hypothetical protein